MNDTPHRAAIALGANLGDREATLRSAIEAIKALSGVEVVAVSAFHVTAPVVPAGADAAAQPDYLNAALTVATRRAPHELMAELQRIERAHGRVRTPSDRWGARTLDLDLLLYDDVAIDEPGLTIPHPRMHERLFVLAPLAEVAPSWRHPILSATVRELLDRVLAKAVTL